MITALRIVHMIMIARHAHLIVLIHDLNSFYLIGYCTRSRIINTALCGVRVDCCKGAFDNDVENMAWIY